MRCCLVGRSLSGFRKKILFPPPGTKSKPSRQQSISNFLVACFWLSACLTCSPILKMEVVYPYETSINFCKTTRPQMPEDSTIRHFFKLGRSVQSVYKLTLQEHCIAVKTIYICRQILLNMKVAPDL